MNMCERVAYLEDGEDPVTGGGGLDPHVQDGAEGALLLIDGRHVELLAVRVLGGGDLTIGLQREAGGPRPRGQGGEE